METFRFCLALPFLLLATVLMTFGLWLAGLPDVEWSND